MGLGILDDNKLDHVPGIPISIRFVDILPDNEMLTRHNICDRNILRQ